MTESRNPSESPDTTARQPASGPIGALSADDALNFVEQLAAVTGSRAPLAPALRAAAEEIPQRRLSIAMNRLAMELEAGRSLEHVLANNPRFLPPHMQRLIEIGAQSGSLPEVLVRLIEIDRTSSDLHRSVRLAMAYPVVLLVIWLGLLAFFSGYIVPDMMRVFKDFKTELPLATRLLEMVSGKWMPRVLGFLAAAIPMLIVSLRILRRPTGWQRLLTEVPLVGPTLLWRGVANWCRLVSLLLEHAVPLPEALRLAANGIHEPFMVNASLRAARNVENGKKLSDALAASRLLPASLIALVRWGEQHNTLPEAFKSAAEMFERRVQMRAALLQSVLPPFAFVITAFGAFWLVNAMSWPLIRLITDLSSAGGRRKGSPTGPLTMSTEEFEQRVMLAIGIAFAVWLGITLIIWIVRSSVGGFLFALAGRSGQRTPNWKSTLFAVLRVGYWILTLFSLLVVMSTLAGWLGVLLWLATLAILVMLLVRYGEMERRSLLCLLGLAMDKGIPLANAAQAFADERHDRLGRKTGRLAISLHGGAPLDIAMAASRNRLPYDALVAVRAGSTGGNLPALLKTVSESGAVTDSATHAAMGRMVYLVFFALFAIATFAFLCIKIVPAYSKIFADFHRALPATTIAVASVAYGVARSGLVALILAATLICLMYAIGRYTGVIRWDAPLVRRFTLPLDQALVLRTLTKTVDQKRSIGGAIAALAQQYPKNHIRRRLWKAAGRIGQGLQWCDALTAAGLLPTADAGVLKAAERVGNLPWAMTETADRLARRFTTRVTTITSVAFPVVIIIFGAIVFFTAVGMLEPLSKLISDLSTSR